MAASSRPSPAHQRRILFNTYKKQTPDMGPRILTSFSVTCHLMLASPQPHSRFIWSQGAALQKMCNNLVFKQMNQKPVGRSKLAGTYLYFLST
ncbi:hypothetical protein E2320_004487, partial [Naja naja]